MAPDSHDRWLFLLTLAATPLACTDEVPGETTSGETTGTTTTPMPSDTTTEGTTSIVTTTGVDGTSSSGGETTVVDESSGSTSSSSSSSSSSSEGTTMAIDPSTSTSTGEESSTTEEPQSLCEVWGENQSGCYGGFYPPAYYANLCYEYLLSVDVMCGPAAAMVYQCQVSGCFVDCIAEYDALQACNDLVQAMELGCDMLPEVPGVGTIDTQCMGIIDQVIACTASGYYIPAFSGYVGYDPAYAQDFCVDGAFFADLAPPPAVDSPCGGAYEELLTCLSGLSCGELEDAMFDDAFCGPQKDAVTCRCELGA
jgi:hypothetical protein